MRISLSVLFLVSCVLSFILFVPFTLHLNDHLINAGDPLFYAWNLSHNIDSLHNGFRNLINTNIFYPEINTLAYSDTLFAQTLFLFPIYVITKNIILSMNTYIMLTFPFSAISMFLLSYYLTKNKLASFLSGIFFAFSYPRIAQLSHIPALSSQWLPLYTVFLIHFFREGKSRDVLLFFLFFLLSLLSSMYFGVFGILFGSIIVCGYLVVLFTRSRKQFYDRIKKLIIVFIPFLFLTIIAIFPYIQFKVEHPLSVRSIDESSKYSAQVLDYISVLPTSTLASLGFPNNSDERVLYPTVSLLFLALIGIVFRRKESKHIVILFSLLAVSAFVLSFGPVMDSHIRHIRIGPFPLPYAMLYRIFPLLQIVRVPSRFSIFFILSLSVLSAFGIEAVTRRLNGYTKYFVSGLIFCFFIFEISQSHVQSVVVPTSANLPAVYLWLSQERADAIIVEVPLTPMHWGNQIHQQITKEYGQISDADMISNEAYRVYFSSYHKKRMMNGYSGFFPDSYYSAAFRLASFPSEDSLKLIKTTKVTYIIVHMWQYSKENQRIITELIKDNPSLKLLKQFDQDYVYELH